MQNLPIMTDKIDLIDFHAIKDHSEKTSRITERLIDGFLISFAASRYDLAEDALKQAGCNLILTNRMPLMDEAMEGLFNSFINR